MKISEAAIAAAFADIYARQAVQVAAAKAMRGDEAEFMHLGHLEGLDDALEVLKTLLGDKDNG